MNFGYGISGAMFQPNLKQESLTGAYAGGLSFKYRGEKYIGFQADLNYSHRGYKLAPPQDTTTTRTLNSIMLPIMAQGTIGYKKLVVIINLGCYASYMLNSKVEKSFNGISAKDNYEFILARDHRYEFGALAGAGFYFDLNPILVQLEARYYYGLTNLLNPNYMLNKPYDSRQYQLLISAGLFFDLGTLFNRESKLTKN